MKSHNNLLIRVYNRINVYKLKLVVILLLTFLSAIIGTLNPLLLGKIIDEAILKNNFSLLVILTVSIVLAQIAVEVTNAIRRYTISTIVINFTRKLKQDIFASLLNTSFDFFLKNPKGEIFQRVEDDTKSVQSFSLLTLPAFIYDMLLAIFSMVVIFTIYWPLGIIGVVIYTLYTIPVRYYGNKQRVASLNITEHESKIKQNLIWKLESNRLIKIFGTEKKEYEEELKLQKKWAKLTHSKYIEENKFRNFPRVLDALAPGLVYGIGGWQVINGNLGIGELFAITRLLPAINAPIRSFSSTFLAFKSIGVRLERVFEYIDLPIEVSKKPDLIKKDIIKGEIIFKDVCYEANGSLILKDISFKIKAGEHVALVGFSGSGKSTILQLLTRNIEPTKGEIYIDGLPLHKIDSSTLRETLSYIQQSGFLFNCSVMDNLCFLREKNIDEVKEITKAVYAHDFIKKLPQGYDTYLYENGKALSGGQKQRIEIARALIKDPDLLLLDEATSALDSELEKDVLHSIRDIMKTKTSIFVAHRLDHITSLDKIIVLKDGNIVEIGTHESLIAKKEHYYSLFNINKNSEVLLPM
ncbi:ABC transporter ATP-binding protein [Cytobacillus oceanisediminis]|uniref:ABC transporter ATP-binding protein n=1 Tax=Cytobacillus oceanisediminis TaxID=665099 RepID=UPI00207AB26E|nr:ABC transporter ATP-binding protein [Cytobacillus oceanisediminis]USK44109.1 ABC transporter ATP-binding protein/permease [Cytobacillus oceanisediminis]